MRTRTMTLYHVCILPVSDGGKKRGVGWSVDSSIPVCDPRLQLRSFY